MSGIDEETGSHIVQGQQWDRLKKGMRYDRALLIMGQDIQSPYHHRGEHLARYLANHFANVDIISMTKMYDGPGTDPVWKKGLLGLRDVLCKRVKEIHDGNVRRYAVRFPRLPGPFDYLLRDFWTYLNLRGHLKEHYDVCILAHPRLAFVALRLKRLGRVGLLIYDDWDYFPGLFPNDVFWYRIMRTRERICARNADGVASVSHSLQELRKRQGARQTTLVPNGVDYALFEKAQQKRDHPPTLLYMGTLANVWGAANLPIMALPVIKKRIPEIRYVIVGGGPDESGLRAMVSGLGLDGCVHFLGNQEYESLPRFLAEADIGVAMSVDNEFRRYACPLKIVEYMAAGLPVIGSQFGETQFIIEKAKAGRTVEFSEQAFAAAVVDFLTNQIEYDVYSANAVTFAKAYDWDRLLDQEFAFIERVAELCHTTDGPYESIP